jgi:histidyl-tRNA synthetase
MSTKVQAVKGTFDLLPFAYGGEKWQGVEGWHYLEKVLRECSALWGFGEVRTPIFEATELFCKNTGESSDIVTKEMYTFVDKGERSLTLRPEGTPCVLRALAKTAALPHQLHKLYYIGPMFRYERPQAGRYRQFHQYGVEALGPCNPELDAETICLGCEIYQRLGIKNIVLNLNTLGDAASRSLYRQQLIDFFTPHKDKLSEDSQRRLHTNPLRILDSKDLQDKALLQGAPLLANALSEASRRHFERVQQLLQELGIAYQIEPKLVRGLDYYCETVFEFVSADIGAQSSLGGGGRYLLTLGDSSVPNCAGVGFGMGLERVIQAMIAQQIAMPTALLPLVYFIPLGEAAQRKASQLALQLRRSDIPCQLELQGRKLKAALQEADAAKAKWVVILGDEELQSQRAQLKNMAERTTFSHPLEELLAFFAREKETL